MRLIDADRALEIVRDQGIAHPNAYQLTNYATLILREVPTIDAVPVVRCKDCVNGTVFVNKQGAEYVDCVLDDYSVRKPTDYCSYGKREEGDD